MAFKIAKLFIHTKVKLHDNKVIPRMLAGKCIHTRVRLHDNKVIPRRLVSEFRSSEI